MNEVLSCISCKQSYSISEIRYLCDCGSLLNVSRDTSYLKNLPVVFDERLASRKKIDRSGVWRFREGVLNAALPAKICTHPEGITQLYQRKSLSLWADCEQTWLKHEGENPSGSFKDRGMTVAITQAKRMAKKIIACASTGNTSASLACYAASTACQAVVFIPAGKISIGKLSQALAYGATCLSVDGDFDAAMKLVTEASNDLGIYLVNSLNPFRIEGQKTIIWDILQSFNWEAPDWIITPAGNLGNTSAFGKAIKEAYEAAWIKKKPRLAAIQASGANPFFQSYKANFSVLTPVKAKTLASAIQIGNPVNFSKASQSILECEGLVEEVSDQEILAAKFEIDRSGIGCEPASACSLAGLKKLRSQGIIKKSDKVVCILTGNLLKDAENSIKSVEQFKSKTVYKIGNNIKDLEKIINNF